MDIKSLIRTIPNFPKEGIMFRDITTLLLDPNGFKATIDLLIERYQDADIDLIAGVESRGFMFAGALSYALGKGQVLLRKKGKLPGKTISVEYQLEYGTDILEIHDDAIPKGAKVLVIDDLLATGGTALGACQLVEKAGGVVHETCFVVDLPDLQGREKIEAKGHGVYTLVEFSGH